MMTRVQRLGVIAAGLMVAGGLSAVELPNFDASYAPVRTSTVRSTARVPGAVASVDQRTGSPSFIWAGPDSASITRAGDSPESAARRVVAAFAPAYSLSTRALDGIVVERIHDTGRGGVVVVFRQQVDGSPIFGQRLTVLLDRSLAPVALGGTLHPAAAPGYASRAPLAFDEADALAVAFRDLSGHGIDSGEFLPDGGSDPFGRRFALSATGRAAGDGFVLTAPARAGRTWFALGDELVAAYQVELLVGHDGSTDADAYSWVIAADDGRILRRKNLTADASFDYRVWADPVPPFTPLDGPMADFTPHPTGVPDGSIPAYTSPVLITMEGFNSNPDSQPDPWLATGATESRGNNVDAYTDDNTPDGFSAGDLRASTTAANTFDRTYDTGQGPLVSDDQKMAAVTQLFYTNNWLHDYWYDSGFDEAAGNAQLDNYGRGGVGGDPLRAEAQDGALAGSRNNANMSTPADGISPRMQMYLWTGTTIASLALNPGPSPSAVGTAAFGPQSFDVTASVVLVNDGSGTTTDGCSAIQNNVAGAIALVDRGNCSFASKVAIAEAAGAVGVILANNAAGGPPGMATDNVNFPTIGVLSITLADGTALKAALGGGPVTATMTRVTGVERDGDLDGAIVSHEWGHYLHHRLADCGTVQCGAQSEGWGDFLSLHTMLRPTDDFGATFAVGQYGLRGVEDAYFGIRRYPYSTDTSKNALSFRHISDGEPLPATASNPNGAPNSEVHNAGEIWATMMFEAYVELLNAHPFDEARRRMADYVVTGLQLVPSDATFTEQRDALLAAAFAADPLDADRIAEAFARRGAGACAVSPPRASADLVGVVEDFDTLGGTALIEQIELDDSLASCDADGYLDAGEHGEVRITVRNGGMSTLSGLTLDLSSSNPGLTFPDGASVSIPEIPPFASTVVSARAMLDPAKGGPAGQSADLSAEIADASLCVSPVQSSRSFTLDVDEEPSTFESVEARQPPWTETGSAPGVWQRVVDPNAPGNHVFVGVDSAFVSDAQLATPELEVSPSEDFVVQFWHRHSFEADTTYWDGGVLEVSTDGGASWDDVTAFGTLTPGYGGTLTDTSGNPLALRSAFVGDNAAWPNRELVVLDFGATLAGQTVQLRFRIGTDAAVGAFGWEVDNLAFSGITNQPFLSLVADATAPCPIPPDAPAVVSTSPSPSTWSTGTSLEVGWTPPASAQPIAGYSYVIDSTAGTTPDETPDTTGVAFTGALPGEGDWYFHVRACDDIGVCGPASHTGPFRVDATPPSTPTGVASPSHDGGPSTVHQIAATWQAATDALSGVTGYVVRFDGNPSGSCQPGASTPTTTILSPHLGCGQWYVHVCTVDAAGNLSPVATGGPWEIVSDFFCDGFESGDTLGWSTSVP